MAGIYIHIPYCKKLCNYCDFYHIIYKDNPDEYINALIKEAGLRRSYTGDEMISTIYFGGGTPSVLLPAHVEIILDHIYRNFPVDTDCEITLEMNPDDVTVKLVKDLKKIKINRISLGVQSFDDEDLKMLNRRHSEKQASDAVHIISQAGIENISIDLIYGLPGMTTGKLEKNLNSAFLFPVKHLSAYHLTIEAGTVFGKMKESGVLAETDEEESIAQYNLICDRLAEEGLIHYEISNFGKEGYFSRHNINYWKQVSYLGLGASAHSYNGYSRQWNIRSVTDYVKGVNAGCGYFEKEELDIKTRFNEYVMTSLRTMWGMDLDYIEKTFDREGYDYARNMSAKFISYGLMKNEKDNLILTRQGEMISDNIISEFMMPE